jgi:hypothetical protein
VSSNRNTVSDDDKQYGKTQQGSLKSKKSKGYFPTYPSEDIEEHDYRAPDVKTSKEQRPGKKSPSTELKETGAGAGEDDDPVKFIIYSPSQGSTNGLVSDTAADISGAQNQKDVIMRSGNKYVDFSKDSGATWNRFDPKTLFPTLGSGFCCDQIVHYIPKIDRFVWYMQHRKGADGSGVFRIAVASPSDMKNDFATAWTYWDFRSDDFNLAGTDLDYPDISWTNKFLHLCTDAMGIDLLICRIPLNELAAGGTINFRYTNPNDTPGDYGSHLVQNSHDGAFWAGHRDNANLWVYSWPDSSDNYSWSSVAVSKWPNGTLSSTSPSSVDWLTKLENFPRYSVIGATRSGNILWFAWSASSGQADSGSPNYVNAHVRVAQVDITTMTTVAEIQIWNNDYAFAYPSLNTNKEGEVGIALGWGGKSNDANSAVGILGDYIVWYANGSELTTKRWGDYVTCRSAEQSNRFAGFGYFIKKDSTRSSGYYFDPYYVLFGRS